jgi:hypothetical protein
MILENPGQFSEFGRFSSLETFLFGTNIVCPLSGIPFEKGGWPT